MGINKGARSSRAGAQFRPFLQDALRKDLVNHVTNIPPDERICDVVVKPARFDYYMCYAFLELPAMIVAMILALIIHSPPWWTWGILVYFIIFPRFFRNKFQRYLIFELWIWTDKALHRVNVGRGLGNMYHPITEMTYSYADIKCAAWFSSMPNSIQHGKGTLLLYTDYELMANTIELPCDLARVKRTMDSLLYRARPPLRQLADYLKMHQLTFDPRMPRGNFPISEGATQKLKEKVLKIMIFLPILESIIAIIVWGAFQLSLLAGWLFLIFGGLFAVVFGFGAWDGIHRINHHKNIGSKSLQITPSGIQLNYGHAKLPQELEFSPDWCFALVNVLETVSLAWTAMNAVEIFDLSDMRHPSMKLGILNPADFFPFYLLLMENYNKWLEQNVPGYFQTPAEIQGYFIKEDPFHLEILQLLEASRKNIQGIGENGHAQYDVMRQGEEILTYPQESALIPAPSKVGEPIPRQELRYSIISYSPHFEEGERILFVYHTPNPGHAWSSPVNLGILLGFIIGTVLLLIGGGVSGINSPFYLLYFSFGMIVTIFGLIFLGTIAVEYSRLRALEMVFTTTHVHYKAKYKYEVVPYNKIYEVRRTCFNSKTGEYQKVLFLRNQRPMLNLVGDGVIDLGMPEDISCIPRNSPIFPILKAQGVFVSEEI